jgi:hypothetical protein
MKAINYKTIAILSLLVFVFLLGFSFSVQAYRISQQELNSPVSQYLRENYGVDSIEEYRAKLEQEAWLNISKQMEALASEYPEINFSQWRSPDVYRQYGTSTYQPPKITPQQPFYIAIFSEPVTALQIFSLSGLDLLGLVAVPPVRKSKHLKQALVLGAVVLCVFSVGYFVGLTAAQTWTTAIEPGSLVETASYVIWTDGTYVYAKNGKTGAIDFKGTDASTVIQSAINALGTDGGKIFIRKGVYYLPTGLTITQHSVILEGEGARPNGTVLRGTSTGMDVITLGDGTNVVRNGVIRDMQIRSTNSDTANRLIYFKGRVNDFILEDLFLQFANYGIQMDNFEWVTLRNVNILNCKTAAMYIYNITPWNGHLLVERCGFAVPTGANDYANALRIETASGANAVGDVVFLNCQFSDTTDIAHVYHVYLKGTAANSATQLAFIGCLFESMHTGTPTEDVGFYSENDSPVGFYDCIWCGNNKMIRGIEDKNYNGRFVIINCAFNSLTVAIYNRANQYYIGYIRIYNVTTDIQNLDRIRCFADSYATGKYVRRRGTATFSGNGSTTTFTIAHGLVGTPTSWRVEAGSADAKGDKYVTADATNLYVTFATAPPSGTNNVVLVWSAEI